MKRDKYKEKISTLHDKIYEITLELDRYKEVNSKLEIENKSLLEYKNKNEGIVNATVNSLNNENRHLVEIIRWHISPKTTHYPFAVEKSQRDQYNNKY